MGYSQSAFGDALRHFLPMNEFCFHLEFTLDIVILGCKIFVIVVDKLGDNIYKMVYILVCTSRMELQVIEVQP